MSDFILETKNITKRFGETTALDNVCFQVERGTIHALAGENGAGKSTLMKILSGVWSYGEYEGEFYFNGKECRFSNLRESEKKGIVIIHQELALIPELSIAENIFLGNEIAKHGIIDWKKTRSEAEKYMKLVGLDESPLTLVKNIGTGKQQLVEIAKALSKNAKLLILDEPTSSLNEKDADRLLELISGLCKNGMTAIIISHKLSEISKIADAITILRDGKTIETIPNSEHRIDENRIIHGMVGREITYLYPIHDEYEDGEVVLSVRNWTVMHPEYEDRAVVKDVSFNLRKGEIVGFAGLQSAGRTELSMSIFGESYGIKTSGELYIKGQKVNLKSSRQAIDAGLAYVTEDRKENGLILNMLNEQNVTLASLEKVSENKSINTSREQKIYKAYTDKLNIRGISTTAEGLSGGNQQKVLLAKWLFTDADIIILDEPTHGVDIGAKHDIYSIIHDMTKKGKSVVFVSSELPELIGMCDRIYVMCEGRITGKFKRADANQNDIMKCMLGGGNV